MSALVRFAGMTLGTTLHAARITGAHTTVGATPHVSRPVDPKGCLDHARGRADSRPQAVETTLVAPWVVRRLRSAALSRLGRAQPAWPRSAGGAAGGSAFSG